MYINQLHTVLKEIFLSHRDQKVEERFSTCVWGAAGIGKTDTMSQIATELDMVCVPVRISQLDASELVGIPRSHEVYPGVRVQVYDLPGYLPHTKRRSDGSNEKRTYEDGVERDVLDLDLLGAKIVNRKSLEAKHGHLWKDYVKGAVIFFDEINRATDDQSKQAIFELVESYVMHTYECPSNTVIVSAANPPNDQYMVNEMDQERAFMDRFLHLVLESRPEDFLLWADRTKKSPLIYSYINKNMDSLMKQEEPIDLGIVASPRSWGKFMHNLLEHVDLPNDDGIIREVFQGVVGDSIGHHFKDFLNDYHQSVPTGEDIFLRYEEFQDVILQATEENDIGFITQTIRNLTATIHDPSCVEKYQLTEYIEDQRNCNPRMNNFSLFLEDLPKEVRQIFIVHIPTIRHFNKALGPCQALYQLIVEEQLAAHNSN